MATKITTQLRRRSLPPAVLMGGVLLILALFSLAAGVAAGAGRDRITMLFIVAPVAVLGMLLVTQHFDWVVLAMPITALTFPLIRVPTGTETMLPLALLLALVLCGTWVVAVMMNRRSDIVPPPMNKPILVFSVICCISLVWGIIWRDPILIRNQSFINVQVASLLTILVSMGAALLIGNFIQNEARLKYIVGTFILFGSLMTLTQLFQIEQRLLNDRGLWGMWTVIPAYGLLIAQPKIKWYWRVTLIVLITLNLYQTLVINAAWLSGWVPTITAMLAATFLRSKRIFLVLLIIAAIGVYNSRDFFTQVADENINDGSLQRLSLWEQNWRVVREHWLFGTGPAGYAMYYMTYYREDARSTHNNYLDILAQFGFSGMLAWLWLAGAGIVEGWRLVRSLGPGFLRTLAIMATSGWIGGQFSMFFGDWMLPFAYNQGIEGYKYTVYTWLFLGTLISIRQIYKRQSLSETPPKSL